MGLRHHNVTVTFPNGTTVTETNAHRSLSHAVVGKQHGRWVICDFRGSCAEAQASARDAAGRHADDPDRYTQVAVVPLLPVARGAQ